ncbi:MAG: hypothetical protein MJH10_09760 [Epibacterium sp.]|nr:hypothetical protein [Epibacterium sp.]NQX73821.1 hypothetical protein [Epibacterium sp.]
MTKKTFNIYYTDPETGEEVVVMKSFSDIETETCKKFGAAWKVDNKIIADRLRGVARSAR